jgi:hypothetical protein
VSGRAGSTFPAGLTTPELDAVYATQQHAQSVASTTARQQSSGTLQDSREVPAHPASTASPAATAAPAKSAPVKPAPAHAASAAAKPTPANSASTQPRPAHAAVAKAAPAKPKPAPVAPRPYHFYDSVTPTAIPAGQIVATYANGSYFASPSAVAGRGQVLWIDTNGGDPQANALDVEPGDATPAGAAAWVQARLTANPNAVAIVYTMISEWQSVKDNVATLPTWMQAKVKYWIADPTGVDHVLPGADATQWYWGKNYDISTANPGFQG